MTKLFGYQLILLLISCDTHSKIQSKKIKNKISIEHQKKNVRE